MEKFYADKMKEEPTQEKLMELRDEYLSEMVKLSQNPDSPENSAAKTRLIEDIKSVNKKLKPKPGIGDVLVDQARKLRGDLK